MKTSQECYPNMVQSMVHGLPKVTRQQWPCMFEMLTGPHYSSNQGLKRASCQYISGDINIDDQDDQQACHHCNQTNGKSAFEQNMNQQQLFVQPLTNPDQKKKTLKSHEVHDELYMYEQKKLRVMTEEPQSLKTQMNEAQIDNQKLNPDDQKDRQIIEKRKKRIKEFSKATRDLPNSAFVTYYGKPAFQAYGRCNSSKNITHNVMPHKGQNKPKNKQTYTSALIHGKKLKNKTYVPRKPLELRRNSNENLGPQEVITLPLNKPDLINHVRFSESQPKQKKQKMPQKKSTAKKLKKSKSTMHKSTGIFPNEQNKKKGKKDTKKRAFNDGLKYMNIRDNLLDLLEKKKTKESRLAYKVTECYPNHNNFMADNASTYSEQCPAGKSQEKGYSAKQVIYNKLNNQ